MLIPMKADRIILDPISKSPILILQEIAGERLLPIWIGQSEAIAIAFAMEKIDPPRPLTHDLAMKLVASMGGRILRTLVTALEDKTYYAVLVVESHGVEQTIDSRPSDAIALALRSNAPILVEEKVLADAYKIDVGEGADDEEGKRWKEFLESLHDEDFGKYKM